MDIDIEAFSKVAEKKIVRVAQAGRQFPSYANCSPRMWLVSQTVATEIAHFPVPTLAT